MVDKLQVTVYYLEHLRPTTDYYTFPPDYKAIGIFESRALALEVAKSLKDKHGFNEFPDNFIITEYIIDEIALPDGFEYEVE